MATLCRRRAKLKPGKLGLVGSCVVVVRAVWPIDDDVDG